MKNKRLNIFQIIFTLIFWNFGKTMGLKCYNSESSDPRNVVECNSNENCYGEYYAVKADKERLIQKFDRFCVHEIHCRNRGMSENCVNVTQLDAIVRKTFKNKLSSSKLNPDNLLYSRFCCCTQDLCNSMSREEIGELFNITAKASKQLFDIFSSSFVTFLIIFNIPL